MQKPCLGSLRRHVHGHIVHHVLSQKGHACSCLHSTTVPCTPTGKPHGGDGSKQEKCMSTRFPALTRWWESIYARKREILLKALTKSRLSPDYWVPQIKTYIPFDLTWGGKREGKPSKPSWRKELTVATNFSNKWLWTKCFPSRDTKSLRPSCSCKPVLHVNHRHRPGLAH